MEIHKLAGFNLDINLDNDDPVFFNCPTCNAKFIFNNMKERLKNSFIAFLEKTKEKYNKREKILTGKIEDFTREVGALRLYLYEEEYNCSRKMIDEKDENVKKELELEFRIYNGIISHMNWWGEERNKKEKEKREKGKVCNNKNENDETS
jgi:hypothetical protein